MGAHLVNGQFQSDKYPTCPPGKVPLSIKDPTAQDLLWTYAQRRRSVDAEFSADLETALVAAGFQPPAPMRLWNNETDTYVARSAEHASELYEVLIGEKYDAAQFGKWTEDKSPHSDEITIATDDGSITKTITEWIAENHEGGMLCATE